MYHSFYHLNQDPFQISTDPKFLWLGEKHKEALATLNYGILNNKSFLLLTGDVGTGKTTLINALLRVLDKNTQVAIVQDPGMQLIDFLNYIADAFGLAEKFSSKGDFLIAFRKFLAENFYKGKKVILLIDEAQRLTNSLLEEVRLLSNIEIDGSKLINIFFVGQNELNSLLTEEENKAMRQRITTSYNIPPLTVDEVAKYIEYRLAVAGARERIFDKSAVKEIFRFSRGYPRLINIICDRALLTGFVKGSQKITGDIAKESARDLDISISASVSGSFHPRRETQIAGEKKIREDKDDSVKKKSFPVAVAIILICAVFLGFWFFPGTGMLKKIKISSGAVPLNSPGKDVVTETTVSPGSLLSKGQDKEIPPVRGKVKESEARILPSESPPETIKEVAKSVVIVGPPPQKVIIPYASNSITPENNHYFKELNVLADWVQQKDHAQLIIRGYTDLTGPEEYNKRLAAFRANAIQTFLIGRGVAPVKIKSIGLGGVAPDVIVRETGEHLTSRRVEVEVVLGTD